MKRHYYVSDDLDDLEIIERQLEAAGVTTPQIHVLSYDDSGLDEHHLHKVEAVLKKDVVHGTELGALVGIVGASLVIGLAWWSGLTDTYTWMPAIFLAIVILGFCTWEGGLIGIGQTHSDFRRFETDLDAGRHVLFVDITAEQEYTLDRVIREHPRLQHAGDGPSTPAVVVGLQNIFQRVMKTAP